MTDAAARVANGPRLRDGLVVTFLPIAALFALLGPQGLSWLPGVLLVAMIWAAGLPGGAAANGPELAIETRWLVTLSCFLGWAFARAAPLAGNLAVLGLFAFAIATTIGCIWCAARIAPGGRWYWGFFPLIQSLSALVTLAMVYNLVDLSPLGGARFTHDWHYNRIAVLTALMTPLSLYAAARMRVPPTARAGIVAAVLALVAGAVAASQSGSAKLALAAILAAVLLCLWSRETTRMGLQLAVAAAFVVVPLAVFAQYDAVRQSALWNVNPWTVSERLRIWRASLELAIQSPLFGNGIEHVRAAGLRDAVTGQPMTPNHPHSFIIQCWVDLGAIGVVLLGWCLWSVLGRLGAGRADAARMNLPLAAGSLAVWAVSHGMWQSWYVGLVGIVASLHAVAVSRAAAEDAAG